MLMLYNKTKVTVVVYDYISLQKKFLIGIVWPQTHPTFTPYL